MIARALGFALLGLVLSSCGSPKPLTTSSAPAATFGSAAPSTTVAAARTEVVRYVPTALPTDRQSGSCWGPSVAVSRAGAYRCMVNNEILDPCFAVVSDPTIVVCRPDPTTGQPGIRLDLSEPLPSLEAVPESGNTAWLVELANGTACTPFTGTVGQVKGQLITYHCAGRYDEAQTVLLGELTTGEQWTAQQAVILPGVPEPQLQSTEVVVLRRVWQ